MEAQFTPTEMQPETSPWTEPYQARPEDTHGQAFSAARMAQDESTRPTHDALDAIYNYA